MNKTRKSKVNTAIIVIAVLVLAALTTWIIYDNLTFGVSETNAMCEGFPEEFSGFKIVQVSDLHGAVFGKNNEKLLSEIERQKPDIIAVTGDLIDSENTSAALEFIRGAIKIAPVYYVTGNHEAKLACFPEFEKELVSAGVTVLRDEKITIERGGEQIDIIGLDDPRFSLGGDMFGEAPAMAGVKLKNLKSDNYSILLTHRPELFDVYSDNGIGLALAGHAHGGQFRLPWINGLYAPNQGIFPKYDGGLYSAGDTHMYVSRGLGNSVFPFRFNNRPELAVINVYRA